MAHAMLWEGGQMIDLNAFVPAGSGITLQQGDAINNRGEILANGTTADGDSHVFLPKPAGDCDADCEQHIAEYQHHPAPHFSAVGSSLAFSKTGDWQHNEHLSGRRRGRTAPFLHCRFQEESYASGRICFLR